MRDASDAGGRVILVTSYIWEGRCALGALLSAGVPVTDVVLQRPWWGPRSHRAAAVRMALRAWFGRDRRRTYQSPARAARRAGVVVHEVSDVSAYLAGLAPAEVALVLVVGAPIIRGPAVRMLYPRIVNFHTGLLPRYRGPYSEFWALYETDFAGVGTSVHLLTEDVDEGPVLLSRSCEGIVPGMTPREAHTLNVLQGCRLLADAASAYLAGELRPEPQQGEGRYLSYPRPEQIRHLETRIGRPVRVKFAD